jgi:ubiquinone/menaquinone biosynthesis C-methylase UbiE
MHPYVVVLLHAVGGYMSAPQSLVTASQADNPIRPDYQAIKSKQQATWASGDFAVIGTTLQIVGETLAEAADICAGDRVIDVAAGNGNATLAAARRFAHVVSTDYVPALLDKGARRAKAEELSVEFNVADAEALPYPDQSFDVAMSTFGVMFAPNHRQSAEELVRVVQHGGRIALANWTQEGFIGQLFKVIGKHLPPPAGLQSPALWGNEPYIVQLFGRYAADIRSQRKVFNFRYRSAEHWLQVFRDYYGPTHKAFAALDVENQSLLASDITDLLNRFNVAGKRALVVPSEYLEVIVVKA